MCMRSTLLYSSVLYQACACAAPDHFLVLYQACACARLHPFRHVHAPRPPSSLQCCIRHVHAPHPTPFTWIATDGVARRRAREQRTLCDCRLLARFARPSETVLVVVIGIDLPDSLSLRDQELAALNLLLLCASQHVPARASPRASQAGMHAHTSMLVRADAPSTDARIDPWV